MKTKRHAGKPATVPPQLSQFVQIRVDPKLYKEVKISALRDDAESISEWVHQILCQHLDREDLMLPKSRVLAAASS